MNANRNTLLLNRPASWAGDMWRTALPCGDGITGCSMYGAIAEEKILINRCDLWQGGFVEDELPDLSLYLAQMREKIDEGDYLSANNIMCSALGGSGYHEGLAAPMPLGALEIRHKCNDVFYNYQRGVRMDRGEVFTSWESEGILNERKMFVSLFDGFVYIKIKGGGESYRFGPHNNGDNQSEAALRDILPKVKTVFNQNDQTFCYTASVRDLNYGTVIKFIGEIDLSINSDGWINVINSSPEKDYIIMLKTFCGQNPVDKCNSIINKFNSFEYTKNFYKERFKIHLDIYYSIWNKVSIKLSSKEECSLNNEALLDMAYTNYAPNALIEKLWRFGRYLFICGTSEKGNPFPLYGLWHGSYNMMWSQNVGNENVQMIYWHAAAGGFYYSIKALIKYYCSKIKGFEKNAKKLFGSNGIYVPTYTAPDSSGPTVNVPVIMNWISGAGWISAHFWEYYLHTGDFDLLISDILPFMYKTALFYESYLVYDNENKAVIYPSVSPENTPGNFMSDDYRENMGHICPVTKNATMDFAVMKQLLTNLITASKLADIPVYNDKIDTWNKILNSIPEYMINSDGAIKEWMTPDLTDNYNHRHLSHIYPLFPGEEINPDSPPELLEAFSKSVFLRQLRGQSGWAFAHMASIWARLGKGESALHSIDMMCKSCLIDNFFTLHNDWRHMGASLDLGPTAPVQLDALMGTVNAVQEMCMRYSNNCLFILPSFPIKNKLNDNSERINDIKIKGLRFPGGYVNIKYKKGNAKVKIFAERDVSLKIFLFDSSYNINLKNGEIYII